MDDPRLETPGENETEHPEFTPYAPVPVEAPPKPEDAPPAESSEA